VSTSPDLCIIGAGTLGVDLALYARRLGASVALADRNRPEPGDGVREALRTASLFESAKRAQDMRRAPELGLGAAESKLQIKQVVERASRLAEERARASSAEILTARGVTVMRGAVSFVDGRTLLIGDLTIKPGKIIVAIGAVPVVPEIPGLADIEPFTTDSILENQRKLTHLIVIGSDAAAVEQAQIQRRLGAEVTLVPHGELLADFDAEAVALLLNALADEGISVRNGGRVVAVNGRSQGIGVEIETAGQREALDASHILVSFGRKADLAELEIAKAKLKAGTNSSRTIRLVGASAGQADWAVARAEGCAMIAGLLGIRTAASGPIPRLVQTEPSLAQIGPAKAGQGESVIRENFAENDRAAAMGSARGLVKVGVDARGQILRASVVGSQASELAGALALAMGRRLGLADLADLPLPRPSLFEIISRLGENYLSSSSVSKRGQGKGALRRLLRF
jgi:pyruvate/2-oxoglutarate dehydrogenase complex dihydrolipoamide dehydrogenase (E3) component